MVRPGDIHSEVSVTLKEMLYVFSWCLCISALVVLGMAWLAGGDEWTRRIAYVLGTVGAVGLVLLRPGG